VGGATQTQRKILIDSWRVLKASDNEQEQNEPMLDSKTITWIINVHQFLLRHKSLSYFFPFFFIFRNALEQLYIG